MHIKFGESELMMTEKGIIKDITFREKSIFPQGQLSYLIRLFKENEPVDTESVTLDGNCLTYNLAHTAEKVCVEFTAKEGYTVFEVTECPECFDFLTVGPIVTTLNDVVGDVVGIVQGKDAAIGIQALNIKTLAGFPYEIAGHVVHDKKEATSFLTVDGIDCSSAAAYDMPFGSVLQLYCENRRRDRVKTVWHVKENVPAPALDCSDADIRGCKFALFACERSQALTAIGRIETGEALPHPMLDGEWLKTSRKAMNSYLICEFGTANIDKMISYTKKGGFPYLYHPEPFDTWGHFGLRKNQFPEGDASLKECVDKAEAQGIKIGLHTLTNFTTTNDAYVTPVPDRRLRTLLPVRLLRDVNGTQTDVWVNDLAGFEYAASLNCFRIEDELLRYSEYEIVSAGEVLLKDCTRGAFGTRVCSHPKGSSVYKLTDYPYNTLFPDIRLQDEFSDRIADLFNRTGVRQISFDGLEGCEWTGEGQYGINRFCMKCYEQFKQPVLNDASRLHHFLWHMHTRMNWGEPWGEEMRTGQVEGRMRNQDFFRKNLFPAMLGWFLIRKASRKFEASTLMDVEWALSEAAGFDAGFAITTSEDVLEHIGTADKILEAVKNWEILRFENRFDDGLKERLKKPETEWHLEKIDDYNYNLYPLAISRVLICDLLEMQPGQPGGSDWSFDNPFEEQELIFRMKVEGNGYIEDPKFYTHNGMIKFHAAVKGGQYLVFDGRTAYVTDRNFNILSKAEHSGRCHVKKGVAPLSFGCSFGGEEGPEVRVRVIMRSEPYLIKRE